MRDITAERGEPDDGEDPIPMTLLSIGQGYWLYEGVELLDDLLFGTGIYPFQVRCVRFKDHFEMVSFFGEGFSVGRMWMINPDVVERLRRENLLVEITPDGA
jgi:hypothetical protein